MIKKIQNKKQEIFEVPKSIFHFHPNVLSNAPTLIPVFVETSDEVLKKALQTEEEFLPKGIFFNKKVGEVYSHKNWIFLGLGEKKKFHPEVILSSFRILGYHLANSGPEEINIFIPFYLEEVLLEFSSLDKDSQNDPWIYGISKEHEAKDRIFFDYVVNYSIEELVKTIIYAIELGGFSLGIYKKNQKNQKKTKVDIGFQVLYNSKQFADIIKEAKNLSDLTNTYRFLTSLPGNKLNPETYEQFVKNYVAKLKNQNLSVKVIKDKQLEKMGFQGVLAVGKGSSVSPRIVIVEYQGKNKKKRPLLLVGKGITFDTGGISLKPPQEMHEMKYDMAGSALVLFSVILASFLKIEYPVIGMLGLAENIPDANASRPGDVYRAWNGVTVEIQNTDAEGRLVMGDILSYGIKVYQPSVVLDFATLTGACIIALGHFAAGVMTASDTLYQKIELASRLSLERVWRLPHWSIYDEQLKSDIADIRNIGGKPAGTITAMRFLSKFVPNYVPWAHFDIAGTAWQNFGPENQKGATGWGLKFMNTFMKILEKD
ncbi:MAG: leucyl aminopeptidase family protein [Leptospiraceae bacterium]|nr:leucyl aminopeptidase family protein [Leptospiraceae bacterium]MDW7977052.1 leucyl aminopeptidase family protein [Leptospiraceae bacterium]